LGQAVIDTSKQGSSHESQPQKFHPVCKLAAAGNALGLRPFGALNALAQSGSGYKALVCVFLFGGNDANNTLIPSTPPVTENTQPSA